MQVTLRKRNLYTCLSQGKGDSSPQLATNTKPTIVSHPHKELEFESIYAKVMENSDRRWLIVNFRMVSRHL